MVTITAHDKAIREYSLPSSAAVLVESGQQVTLGQPLTEGHLDLQQLLKLTGRRGIERYVTAEIQRIYTDQGVTIHNKHVEIIIRQMLSKVMITDPGTTEFITGQTVDMSDIRAVLTDGKHLDSDQQLLGISQIALRTKSFLSAASFQQTVTSLIDAAVQAKKDELRGLKENVIIGKLIPAGTGFSSRVTKGENASESTSAE
jgi:DNA-directed RNA polymerase subunit beta'